MCRTMSPLETSADGLVVGSGVGTDDVSQWEKILASFIAQSLTALADKANEAIAADDAELEADVANEANKAHKAKADEAD